MISFLQFTLLEAKDVFGNDYFDSFHDGRNVKGWMSPEGKPHEFKTMDEHRHNHHPDYIKSGGKQGDSIQDAQKKGFVRYGQSSFGGSMHGSHYFIHYDQKHPQAHQTAIKVIKHLDPPHYAPVTLSGSAGVFRNGRRNAKAIKDLSSEKIMSPREALQHLRTKGKITESKGWMSPTGEVHLFPDHKEHYDQVPAAAKKKFHRL